jgi:hypothetical protein
MEPFTPHALRGLKHALFRCIARPLHRRTRRDRTSTSFRTRRGIAPRALIEEPMYPIACLLAHDIRIVRRGNEADGLGGARVEVAGGVHALLGEVGRERALVVYDDVVRRFDGALQARVRLQVKIEIEHRRHAAVDDGAWTRVAVLVGKFRVGWEEARVVPFAAYEDAQCWVVPGVLGVDPLERLEDLRKFLFDHLVILALQENGTTGGFSGGRLELPRHVTLPLIHHHGK